MPEDRYHNDDAGLFLDFQQGHPAAADTIFLRHVKPLCLFVERLVGDRAEAQDIAADVFMKLLERRGQFESLDHVRAFLYVSARNAAVNSGRSAGRFARVQEQLGFLQAQDETREHYLDNEQIRAEVLGAIYAEIEELPDQCRTIFKAIFIDGLSNEEIAGRMGLAVQTIRSQKSRAIGLLRAQLLKKGRLLTLFYLIYLLETTAEKISC